MIEADVAGRSEKTFECPILCEEISFSKGSVTSCGHQFSTTGIGSWQSRGHSDCPSCRADIKWTLPLSNPTETLKKMLVSNTNIIEKTIFDKKVTCLLELGADVNCTDNEENTLLLLAISNHFESTIEFILSSKALTAATVQTTILLCAMSEMDYTSEVKEILTACQALKLEIDLDAFAYQSAGEVDDENRALHFAAVQGRHTLYNLLVAYGAQPQAENAAGQTALQLLEKYLSPTPRPIANPPESVPIMVDESPISTRAKEQEFERIFTSWFRRAYADKIAKGHLFKSDHWAHNPLIASDVLEHGAPKTCLPLYLSRAGATTRAVLIEGGYITPEGRATEKIPPHLKSYCRIK